MQEAVTRNGNTIAGAVSDLHSDVDGVFHFLDTVDYWNHKTPVMTSAVKAFATEYQASLNDLAVAVGVGTTPPPCVNPCEAPAGAAPAAAPNAATLLPLPPR